MEAAFQHYQFVTKNLSLTLKVENDILKAKIIKVLIVATAGMAGYMSLHEGISQLSLSPPVPRSPNLNKHNRCQPRELQGKLNWDNTESLWNITN